MSGFSWKGKTWQPELWCLSMAWDAFRIAMGATPKTFEPDEVIEWLIQMNRAK